MVPRFRKNTLLQIFMLRFRKNAYSESANKLLPYHNVTAKSPCAGMDQVPLYTPGTVRSGEVLRIPFPSPAPFNFSPHCHCRCLPSSVILPPSSRLHRQSLDLIGNIVSFISSAQSIFFPFPRQKISSNNRNHSSVFFQWLREETNVRIFHADFFSSVSEWR